jgi:hypothetical protein
MVPAVQCVLLWCLVHHGGCFVHGVSSWAVCGSWPHWLSLSSLAAVPFLTAPFVVSACAVIVCCHHPPFAIPPMIHCPLSSCSRGWRQVVCPWPCCHHPHPTPMVHPVRGCSQALEQIPGCPLCILGVLMLVGSSIVVIGVHTFHIHDPPYKQRLTGVGCAVIFRGLLVQGAYRRVSDTGG